MDALSLDLVASGETPLYRQLTEALRYRISSGTLKAGTRLPTLTEGAALWGVNLHTVRRAYLALQNDNLVLVKRPLGTFVSPQASSPPPDAGQRFVLEAMEEARRRFGLTGEAFSALALAVSAPRPAAVLHVVECSHTLAEALAQQLRKRWPREVWPHRLDDLGRVGDGPVVATYFHFNEVRAAFSHRIEDVHFVSIAPDPDGLRPVQSRALDFDVREVVLCERDAVMGRAVAADVRRLFPAEGPEVRVEVPASPSTLLEGPEQGPILFSPGSWELLSEAERKRADAFPLTYNLSPAELPALGKAIGLE